MTALRRVVFLQSCIALALFVTVVSAQGHSDGVTATPSRPLKVRGLYVQFARPGLPTEYWSGEVIQNFRAHDTLVRGAVSEEVERQLDAIRDLGVNTITFELRAADGATAPGPLKPPHCNVSSLLGLRWPKPTPVEISNLVAFLDLLDRKGLRVFLRLVNTHMEEQPPVNAAIWHEAILGAIKNHPALDLVLFEGNSRTVDTDGDGVPDACGIPAEAPLWLGPSSVPARYVKWAIDHARRLGMPFRKLSSQAIVGDFSIENRAPSGPHATERRLWSPILVLKRIFDELAVPEDQRTYAISFYQQRKCKGARLQPCIDADPHTWAEETLQTVFSTIGQAGARVVAPEMGVAEPMEDSWRIEQALESLVNLMEKYGVDGGCLWRWPDIPKGELRRHYAR